MGLKQSDNKNDGFDDFANLQKTTLSEYHLKIFGRDGKDKQSTFKQLSSHYYLNTWGIVNMFIDRIKFSVHSMNEFTPSLLTNRKLE